MCSLTAVFTSLHSQHIPCVPLAPCIPPRCPFLCTRLLSQTNVDAGRVMCAVQCIFTVWFLMFPIAVLGLVKNAADFDRTNHAWAVWTARNLFGYFVMIGLWWPNHHNVLFPFERSASASAGYAQYLVANAPASHHRNGYI